MDLRNNIPSFALKVLWTYANTIGAFFSIETKHINHRYRFLTGAALNKLLMQIDVLRIKNINSLYGQWTIDFRQPEYRSYGLFAITGPTGSGKSTILDAISLALFGRTPRQKHISESTNEIISRGEEHCEVQLEFRIAGKEYRATWSQHRTGKRAKKNFRKALVELVDKSDEKILATAPKEFAAEIARILGNMNYEQFTRSILLAQGDFDSFLKAGANERSPILERITGTKIYREISMAAYHKATALKQKRDELAARLGDITLLGEEEKNRFQTTLDENRMQEKSLQQRLQILKQQTDFLETLAKLEKEIEAYRGELKTLQRSEVEFQKHAQALQQAKKAARIDADYRMLTETNKSLENHSRELAEKELALPKMQEQHRELHEELESVTKNLAERETKFEQMQDVWKKARALDREIEIARKEFDNLRRELEKTEQELNKGATSLKELRELEKKQKLESETLESYFRNNAADETLQEELSGLQERIRQWHGAKKKLHAESNTIERHAAKLQSLQKKLLHEANDPETLRETLSAQSEALELRKTELLDEKHRRLQIQSLEEYRHTLKGGSPCPLCGALEHPFASLESPDADEIQTKLTECEKQSGKIRLALDALHEFLPARKELERLHNLFQESWKNAVTEMREIRDIFSRYGVTEIPEISPDAEPVLSLLDTVDFETLLEPLQTRRETWKRHRELRVALLQQRGLNEERRKHLESTLETRRLHFAETTEKQNAAQQSHENLTLERKTLFGEEDPERSEQAFKKELQTLRAKREKSQDDFQTTENAQTKLQTEITSLKNVVETAKKNLLEHRRKVREQLDQAGFAEEADYLQARLEPEKQEQLEREAEHLKKELARVHGLLEEKQRALLEENQKPHPEETLEQLQKNSENATLKRTEIIKEIGTLEQRLKTDEEQREKHRNIQLQFEMQLKESNRFSALSALIGGSKGDQFSRIAQGLTLELLLRRTNEQLSGLSDRYRLVRGKNEPLEILVRDFDHAGEVRPTTNLSGGESFLVSLALSLGLSQISSEKVNTESLFLDEGFGTLDEDTLHAVLSVLGNLQSGGKLIGLISHVEALKERIPTQIQLVQQPGGRSIILGPGVSREGESTAESS